MGLEILFKWILFSSVVGGFLALLIIITKGIFGVRLNARWHYYIWFLLIARLILPVAPQSPLSITNLFLQIQNIQQVEMPKNNNTVSINKGNEEEVSPQVPIKFSDTQQEKSTEKKAVSSKKTFSYNQTIKVLKSSSLFDVMMYLWLAGTLFMLIFVVFINIRMALMIRKRLVCKDTSIINILNACKVEMGIKSDIVVFSDVDINTPMLFTFIKHKLLIPLRVIEQMTEEEKRHIILHELAHLKRKDYLVSWVMVILQILHWFNPFIWYAFYKMKQDCENACDATALSYIEPDKYKAYGNTIIEAIKLFSEPYFIPGASTIGSYSGIKRRISMIINYKKHSAKWSIIAGGLAIILAFISLTNASTSEGIDKKGVVPQTRSTEKTLFVSSEDTIYFPDKVLTDRQLIELRGFVSKISQHLNQHVRGQIMQPLSVYNHRWKSEFLPLLETSKEIEIVTFVNEFNSGFKLAFEAVEDNEIYFKHMTPENKTHMYEHLYFGEREERNQQKLEQARDIFIKLREHLPKILPQKDIMLEDIRNKFLINFKEITIEEAKSMTGFDLIKPKYLPERFKYYGTYYLGEPNQSMIMIKQVWYDLDKIEMLMVTQGKVDSKDLNYEVLFTDTDEGNGKVSDSLPWTKYICMTEFVQKNMQVQGYMLVNDEANRAEYEKILKSLKE